MIGDRYLASLFRLVGIYAIEAANEDAAVAKAKELVEGGECKALFISERVAVRLKALRESLLTERKSFPIFVIVPDFEGALGERKKELTQLVNKSIGVRLKTGG